MAGKQETQRSQGSDKAADQILYIEGSLYKGVCCAYKPHDFEFLVFCIQGKPHSICAYEDSGCKKKCTHDDAAHPENYSHLWGKSLREVKEEIAKTGRPLAPQSIEALTRLFEGYDPSKFDEKLFVKKEMEADAGLYRDTKFRAGLIATLEQRVADYREGK